MARTVQALVGVFDDASQADNAISALEQAGFSSDQIYYSGHQAATGGFLTGLKSLFTGEDTTTGRVTDDLTNMGLSQDEASYYENEYQSGHTVVAVQANGREQDAVSILQTNGAYSYGSRGGSAQSDYATNTATDTAYTTDTTGANLADGVTDADDRTDAQRKIRLREEQLNVEKQRVQSGEVGLHKDVVSEQKTIDVPVSHEEVYIERRPIADGEIDDATPIGQDESIRVPVSAEQVNVNKNTVVTGEVAIGKRAVQDTQRVSDTVKREKLNVDQQGDIPVQDTTTDGTQAIRTEEDQR